MNIQNQDTERVDKIALFVWFNMSIAVLEWNVFLLMKT